ncbi:winged helix-turn-helix domain-containing protein [Paenibacillus macerans]|nr:winged helix-turn-helix domain-containing protein [Paenibacillus macerans]MCY7560912.1 winged helix-turn-helix domain-containing protein [Paenibacillus macerans]MEC0139029.1 winged helix-turn-helix domain-containing protein [Paenibacillus macerans]MEC0152984.1 winged helix-turn-helix domain-containing protein [Paenibacillus macerans]MEC0333597.1 winged helix-turn-helix domain-containing protein [Paenibacillus macerans]SUA86578.1 transcriptional regulator, ArsR family [Paenibacillus macerans
MELDYRVDVTFEPRYELLSSLHTIICRKSHKKIDLAPAWVKETLQCLTPGFAAMLKEMEVDGDWKFTYLLTCLCPAGLAPEAFLAWLEAKTPGDLYELTAGYTQQFPKDMGLYRSRTLEVLSMWNEQYFRRLDPAVPGALRAEAGRRKEELAAAEPLAFVERTTNGLAFAPKEGLERLVLVPQYHFQPMNVIYHFGKVTLCHYAARIHFGDETDFPPQEYRMIRALGEQSRLKILRYLSEGPRTFTEIVRHLQLSKGITHDHVSKLRSGGFIRAHFEGETVTEYSLRAEMLDVMHRKLVDYIKPQG